MIQTLANLEVKYNAPIPIHCDNTSVISVSKNHVFHSKSKHIVLLVYLIRGSTDSLSVFFDIDVKGGEKGVVCMLQLEV
jgi:hypothetical protein